MCAIYVICLCSSRFGLGWAHDAISFTCHIFMHSYAYVLFIQYILIYLNCLGLFWLPSLSLSLSLSLSVYVSLLLWHPNVNLLCPETLFVPGHLLLLILLLSLSGSVMRRPKRTSLRTFPDEAFIQNAKSFCQTSLTLTFLLSSTVGIRVTVWRPSHLSIHADLRVLLQHACIWFFSTSFHYSRLGYAYCCHTEDCLRCAPCPEDRASWLPQLWSS